MLLWIVCWAIIYETFITEIFGKLDMFIFKGLRWT